MVRPGMQVSATAASKRIHAIRRQLLDRIWLGILLVALVGAPASASRALSTGWLPLYSFHVGLAVLVVLLFSARRHLSYMTRTLFVLTVFFLIGTVGMFTLGLLGAGVWWLVMCSLVASTLLSPRTGLALFGASLAVIVLAAAGFTHGPLELPLDADRYVHEPTSWVSFLIAASLLPFVVFQEIVVFQRSTADLVREVEEQRARIEQLATHDALTGLPRWDLVADRLRIAIALARRAGRKVAFLFIDLDGFKAINDALGHDAGDRVLVEMAGRMKAILRDEDTAGRIAGDEFAAILWQLGDEREAVATAERLVEKLGAPVRIGDREVAVGASIGVALFPDHGSDAKELRSQADQAMYAAKRAGKKRCAVAGMPGAGAQLTM